MLTIRPYCAQCSGFLLSDRSAALLPWYLLCELQGVPVSQSMSPDACHGRKTQVAAAADAEQPKGAATPKEGTRVKPFYEAPQFAQTYARAPSLVQQRPPLPPAMHRARADGGRGGQIRQG